MWLVVLIPVVFIIFLVGGIVMLTSAPPKRYDYPSCPRCRYNLTGIDPPPQCPECGASFSYWRIVEPGSNAKRQNMIVGGVVLIALSPFAALFMTFVFAAWFGRHWG